MSVSELVSILINSAIYRSVIFLYDHLEEVGSKLLTPSSATNQRLMSPAMATKKAEKLAPQLPRGILSEEDVRQVHGIQQPGHRPGRAKSGGLFKIGSDFRNGNTEPVFRNGNADSQILSWVWGEEDGCCITSPQEPDNYRQAQSKNGCRITSLC